MYLSFKDCFTHAYHQILSKMITINTMSTVEFTVLAQNVVLDAKTETVIVVFLDIIVYTACINNPFKILYNACFLCTHIYIYLIDIDKHVAVSTASGYNINSV